MQLGCISLGINLKVVTLNFIFEFKFMNFNKIIEIWILGEIVWNMPKPTANNNI